MHALGVLIAIVIGIGVPVLLVLPIFTRRHARRQDSDQLIAERDRRPQ